MNFNYNRFVSQIQNLRKAGDSLVVTLHLSDGRSISISQYNGEWSTTPSLTADSTSLVIGEYISREKDNQNATTRIDTDVVKQRVIPIDLINDYEFDYQIKTTITIAEESESTVVSDDNTNTTTTTE